MREEQPHHLGDGTRVGRPRPQVDDAGVGGLKHIRLDVVREQVRSMNFSMMSGDHECIGIPTKHRQTLKNIAAPKALARLHQGRS